MNDRYSALEGLKTKLELNRDEALVLFEFLSKFEETDVLPKPDPSEITALWRIHGQLQKTLTEPLQANYTDLLETAKKRLN